MKRKEGKDTEIPTEYNFLEKANAKRRRNKQ